MVRLEALDTARDQAMVRRLVENHLHFTGSERARQVLVRWAHCAPRFVKVVPVAYAELVARACMEGRDLLIPLPAAVGRLMLRRAGTRSFHPALHPPPGPSGPYRTGHTGTAGPP
jgi:hypothetical protein